MTIKLANGTRKLALGLGMAASLLLGATVVSAANPNVANTVSAVEYMPNKLLVQLKGGVNYVGVVTAPTGCTANNQSIETLKAWMSLTQAALLSGKEVRIYYSTCSGTNYITAVDIWQ